MTMIALPSPFPVSTTGIDHGVSAEAARIRGALIDLTRESVKGTVTSRRAEALARLDEAFEEGSDPDRDGGGALEVEASTYTYAAQLVDLLPVDLPLPEIYPEPDGDLAFEWDLGKRRVLSISVGRDGTLHFAGLFGSSKQHGVDFLGDRIPEPIWIALTKLAE